MRLLEVEGGYYAVYTGTSAKKAGQAATRWFIEHLLHGKLSDRVKALVELGQDKNQKRHCRRRAHLIQSRGGRVDGHL
jgi:hypothetical protein